MIFTEAGKQLVDMAFSGLKDEQNKKIIENDMLKGINLLDETKWLGIGLEQINSPILCSHTDFNRGNILIKDNPLEIKLVDLDYTGYNYRGVDLGRYFSCWRQKEMLFGFDRFPTDKEMSLFLKTYINEMVKYQGEDYFKMEINQESSMIREAKYFTLIAYYIDSMFLIMQYTMSPNDKQKFLVS